MALDADFSQLRAVETARRGLHLVTTGPLEPAKARRSRISSRRCSLTKKVLFVSEKTAALDVVKRRLEDCGWASSAEMDSERGKKNSVDDELAALLSDPRPLDGTVFPDETLTERRSHLNRVVRCSTPSGSREGRRRIKSRGARRGAAGATRRLRGRRRWSPRRSVSRARACDHAAHRGARERVRSTCDQSVAAAESHPGLRAAPGPTARPDASRHRRGRRAARAGHVRGGVGRRASARDRRFMHGTGDAVRSPGGRRRGPEPLVERRNRREPPADRSDAGRPAEQAQGVGSANGGVLRRGTAPCRLPPSRVGDRARACGATFVRGADGGQIGGHACCPIPARALRRCE